jgi:hypothetical protein
MAYDEHGGDPADGLVRRPRHGQHRYNPVRRAFRQWLRPAGRDLQRDRRHGGEHRTPDLRPERRGRLGNMASVGIFDAATSGNCLWAGPLDIARDIAVGDSLTIAAGALSATLA